MFHPFQKPRLGPRPARATGSKVPLPCCVETLLDTSSPSFRPQIRFARPGGICPQRKGTNGKDAPECPSVLLPAPLHLANHPMQSIIGNRLPSSDVRTRKRFLQLLACAGATRRVRNVSSIATDRQRSYNASSIFASTDSKSGENARVAAPIRVPCSPSADCRMFSF